MHMSQNIKFYSEQKRYICNTCNNLSGPVLRIIRLLLIIINNIFVELLSFPTLSTYFSSAQKPFYANAFQLFILPLIENNELPFRCAIKKEIKRNAFPIKIYQQRMFYDTIYKIKENHAGYDNRKLKRVSNLQKKINTYKIKYQLLFRFSHENLFLGET